MFTSFLSILILNAPRFLKKSYGLLQSNAIATFKPTETHLKFKLNNLHQKWSFCLDHFGITWKILHLTFCLPNLFGCRPTDFGPLTSLHFVDSESSAAVDVGQQPGGRRATPGVAKVPVATATDRKSWIPCMNFVGNFVPQTCYTGYETGAAIRFHGARCYLQ